MNEPQQEARSLNWLVIAVWVALGILVLLFIINNSQTVDLEILFMDFTMSLWLLVVVFFALGVLAGWVTRWWGARR